MPYIIKTIQEIYVKSIIFVCQGNICRSPLAQGIAEKIIQEQRLKIKVDSAGTGDWHIGEAPCAHSIKVAALNGVDISQQKARQVTLADLETYDLIVVLDQSNYDNVKKIGQQDLVKLGHFGHDNEDVPDPALSAYHAWKSELDTLTSNEFRILCHQENIRLIGYRHIKIENGQLDVQIDTQCKS